MPLSKEMMVRSHPRTPKPAKEYKAGELVLVHYNNFYEVPISEDCQIQKLDFLKSRVLQGVVNGFYRQKYVTVKIKNIGSYYFHEAQLSPVSILWSVQNTLLRLAK